MRAPCWFSGALAVGIAALAGCSPLTPPSVRLEPHVRIPERSVVLITIDGLSVRRLAELLAAGDLPNIQRIFVDGGVRVQEAVATQPTITYANLTTILTGRVPGSHGILGNKWFERYALLYRDYTTTATYRLTDNEFLAPTLYERLAGQPTASVQSAMRRGASDIIDNWATSGIRWFFGFLEDIDWLEIERLALIAAHANQTGDWPVFIHLYLPAVDEIGHRYGCNSAEYRHAVTNVDAQIGRAHAAIEGAGLLDRTCFVLTSDHGHVPVPLEHYLDIAAWLRQSYGWRVLAAPPGGPRANLTFTQRRRVYENVDAVVVVNGDRHAAIHLRGPHAWWESADPQRIGQLLGPSPSGKAPQRPRAARIWDHPAVALAAVRSDDEDTLELFSRSGSARIQRRRVGNSVEYRYDPLEGAVLALEFLNPADSEKPLTAAVGWHDAREWLRATAGSPYPDLVVQMANLFDSTRAGDLVLFAALDWDFVRGNGGGHGSIFRDEVLIPMYFAGPGLPRGAHIETARLSDVAPTILGLLAVEPRASVRTFDGVDLTSALRSAGTSPAGRVP